MTYVNSWVLKAYEKVRKFVTDNDEGATLAEHAMLLAVVTVTLIAAITAFAAAIKTVLGDPVTQLPGG